MTNNPCIVSIFMRNINENTLVYQKKVVDKFNKSNVAFYQVLSDMRHGYTMDGLIPMLRNKGHDAVMFLDIDCVPLTEQSIDYMFACAYSGMLVGDAQRSNHIENNQHVFAGAHNIAFSLETYDKLGAPSCLETHRGDVAEELTYKAEENNVHVQLLMPMSFEAPPIRMAWETNTEPFWRLADGMPTYGIGTTYGVIGEDIGEMALFWHCWQSFHEGQQERFWNKCKDILNVETK